MVNIQIFKTPVNPILNSTHFENLDFWGCYGKHTDCQDSGEPYTELNSSWKPWLAMVNVQIFKTPMNPILNSIHFENLDFWGCYGEHTDFQDSSEPYTELPDRSFTESLNLHPFAFPQQFFSFVAPICCFAARPAVMFGSESPGYYCAVRPVAVLRKFPPRLWSRRLSFGGIFL